MNCDDEHESSRVPDENMASDSSMASDSNMALVSNSETYPPSPVHCDEDPPVSFATKSTRYSFSNKNQVHKNLFLSSKDYENLMLGKNLQFFHPKSGTCMTVRPVSTKPSILTGTPLGKFSGEAAVPFSSPLLVSLSPSLDFRCAEDLEIHVDEADNCLEVKRPRLSPKDSPNYNIAVCEVAAVDNTLMVHSVMDGSGPLLSQNHFVFSSSKMHSGSKCRRSKQSFYGQHRMVEDRTQVMVNNKLSLVRDFVVCRFTKTIAVNYKRKEECSIHFDNLYLSPFKKRRLGVNESVCSFNYPSLYGS